MSLLLLVSRYVAVTNPLKRPNSAVAVPFTLSLLSSSMSVPYTLGPEPEKPANMASEPTEQLKQGKNPTTEATPLLAQETSEGAPETGMNLPPVHGGTANAVEPVAVSAVPDPRVGHDSKLPDRICPGGYGCEDES